MESGAIEYTATEAASRLSALENQELESPKGQLSSELYCEFLGLYLLTEDLPNARFLWQRIPAGVKAESAELEAIWVIGKNAWKRDFGGVHEAINAFEWSATCKRIFDQYKQNLQKNCLSFIENGYSSVNVDHLMKILGLNQAAALEMAKEKGWTYNEEKKIVKPNICQKQLENTRNNEEHLEKLTEYILFLET